MIRSTWENHKLPASLSITNNSINEDGLEQECVAARGDMN